MKIVKTKQLKQLVIFLAPSLTVSLQNLGVLGTSSAFKKKLAAKK